MQDFIAIAVAVEITDNPSEERFEIHDDGALAGYAMYRRRPPLIAFIHTEIDPRFEGRGFGGQLVRAALDSSRAAGLEVLPFCPFVRGYIEGHAEYLDLVPADRRAAFDLEEDHA